MAAALRRAASIDWSDDPDVLAAQIAEAVSAAELGDLAYARDRDRKDVEHVSLGQARLVHFEEQFPIRQPMSYKGQWSKPGRYWFATTRQMVWYESRFEMAHLMLFDFDPRVVDVAWQPFRVHWTQDGRPRRHTPDYFVRFQDESGCVYDVKGSMRALRPANALVFGVTERACREMGLGYKVATDIDPVLLANVSWLAGYRYMPMQVDEIAPYVLDSVGTGCPLDVLAAEVARRSGLHVSLVLPVVFHLMWDRSLYVDLSVPFSGDSLVRAFDTSLLSIGSA